MPLDAYDACLLSLSLPFSDSIPLLVELPSRKVVSETKAGFPEDAPSVEEPDVCMLRVSGSVALA